MAVVAFVTRISPGIYAARRAPRAHSTTDPGGDLGTDSSAGAAQRKAELFVVGGRALKWTRSDMAGAIESYIGETTP